MYLRINTLQGLVQISKDPGYNQNLVGGNGLASQVRQPDPLKQELFLRAVEYKNNMNIESNEIDKNNLSSNAVEIQTNPNPVDKFNEAVEEITTPPSPHSSIISNM